MAMLVINCRMMTQLFVCCIKSQVHVWIMSVVGMIRKQELIGVAILVGCSKLKNSF